MADVRIAKPEAGQQSTLNNLENARLVLEFSPGDATLERSGDNLVFTFNDGSSVALENFYGTYTSTTLPTFEIDGAEVSGQDFFAALSDDLMPAAGPAAAQAADGARYRDFGTADLADGLDKLGGLDLRNNRGSEPENTLDAFGNTGDAGFAASYEGPDTGPDTGTGTGTGVTPPDTDTDNNGPSIDNPGTGALIFDVKATGVHAAHADDTGAAKDANGNVLHHKDFYDGLGTSISVGSSTILDGGEKAAAGDRYDSRVEGKIIINASSIHDGDTLSLSVTLKDGQDVPGTACATYDAMLEAYGGALPNALQTDNDHPEGNDGLGYLVSHKDFYTDGNHAFIVTPYGVLVYATDGAFNSKDGSLTPVNVRFFLDSGAEAVRNMPEDAKMELKFELTVSDGHGGQVTRDLTLNIYGSNDAPLLTLDEAAKDPFTHTGTLTFGDDDAGATLHFEVSNADGASATGGIAGTYGTLTVDDKGNYTYEPLNDVSQGTETFTVSVVDEHGARAEQQLTFSFGDAGGVTPTSLVDTFGISPAVDWQAHDTTELGNGLFGGSGDEILFGSSGDDFLNGGTGVNTLYGGDGNDVLVYSAGNTLFDGGAGIDVLLVKDDINLDVLLGSDTVKDVEIFIKGDTVLDLTSMDKLADLGVSVDTATQQVTVNSEFWTESASASTPEGYTSYTHTDANNQQMELLVKALETNQG